MMWLVDSAAASSDCHIIVRAIFQLNSYLIVKYFFFKYRAKEYVIIM